MYEIQKIINDIKAIQTIDSVRVSDIDSLKASLKLTKNTSLYLDILLLGGKVETALSDYIFRPLMENEEYLGLKISPQIKAGDGWVDFLIQLKQGNPVAIELKPLHKILHDEIIVNPLEKDFNSIRMSEKNQIKQYLRDYDYVLLTNMKEVYYFNREAIFDFKPFLMEDFLTLVNDLAENNDVWDVIRRKEDITPKHALDKSFFEDLKRWYAEFQIVDFKPNVRKEEKIVLILNKFIFLKTLEDYSLIQFNFIRDSYERTITNWETKGDAKVFYEFFKDLNKWGYEYYDTELFKDDTFGFILNTESNMGKLRLAVEKILGLKEWAKIFGVGLIHYNYRNITEDIFGKSYETFLAEGRKARGIFYTPTEITEFMSKTLVEELFGPLAERLYTALDEKDFVKATGIVLEIANIKILDPSCGSGSFLIKLLRHIWKIYLGIHEKTSWATTTSELIEPEDRIYEKETIKRIRHSLGLMGGEDFDKARTISLIILRHLYGIDLDEKAIDVAKVNIWKEAVKLAPRKYNYRFLPEDIDHVLPDLETNFANANSIVDLPLEECVRLMRSSFANEIKSLLELRREYLDNPYEPKIIEEIQSLKSKIRESLKKDFDEKQYGISTTPLFLPLEFFFCYFDNDSEPLADSERGFHGVIGNPPWENIKPVSKEFAAGFPDVFGPLSKQSMTGKDFEKAFNKALKEHDGMLEKWEEYSNNIQGLSEYIRSTYELYGDSGDLSFQKVFLEKSLSIAQDGGVVALLVPSGFHTDEGHKAMRKHIFQNCNLLSLFSFENRGKRWFQDVHAQFKFDSVIIRKINPIESNPVKTGFYLHNIKDTESPILLYPADIENFSPTTLGLVEFRSIKDVEVAGKIRNKHPLLKDCGYRLLSEFHMTNNNDLFITNKQKGSLALYEGKMIHQYEHEFEKPNYWIDENKARECLISKELHRINKFLKENSIEERFEEEDFIKRKFKLDYEDYRLVFRDVGSSTNERSLIATILPPKLFTGNTLNIFKNNIYKIENDLLVQENFNQKEKIFLLAFLNSFTIDYYVRLRVSAHLNLFYVYELPIPEIESSLKEKIINMAVNLLPDNKEYSTLAKLAGTTKEKLMPPDKKTLRANLEATIARDVFGLSKGDLKHILGTFTFGKIDTDLIEMIKDSF